MTQDTDFLKIANDSGFPLQIAIQHQVTATTNDHGWTVRYMEHSWVNRSDGKSGFIDLVLQDRHQTTYLVIECKRVKESTWLFLRSDGLDKVRRHSKSWITYSENGKRKSFGWGDIAIDPKCFEAHFCSIRGQTSNDKPTLIERVGGELISATEGLAIEEMDFQPRTEAPIRFYFNVIVTTARLKVATFLPGKISLIDGTLESAEFKDVPFVRLRKQMSMRETFLSEDDYANNAEAAYSKENTVFVVRADAIQEFLGQFEVPDDTIRQIKFSR